MGYGLNTLQVNLDRRDVVLYHKLYLKANKARGNPYV